MHSFRAGSFSCHSAMVSLNGLAAIYINDRDTIHNVNLISRNRNFMVVRYNDLYIASVYISPNTPRGNTGVSQLDT